MGGAAERSKQAAAMLALHDALRNVCVNYDWTYSVFWTIRPRPRCRGGSSCKVGEDNGSLMLMWEDGYCHLDQRLVSNNLISNMQARGVGDHQQIHNRAGSCTKSINNLNLMSINADEGENLITDGEDPVWKAFRKMSIQLYNYGEGLMGKVASDKCHKWVFKESPDCEAGISSYWQSSFDAHPPEWIDQFAAGIQTIAVIQAGQGLLQLGSCKVIAEDLHFVLRMRHAFESLEYPSGLSFLPTTATSFGMGSQYCSIIRSASTNSNSNNSMMLHMGDGAVNNMSTYCTASTPAAVGFPPPPSPHSWSLCTNQLIHSEARPQLHMRSASPSLSSLIIKASCPDTSIFYENNQNIHLMSCKLQSPRTLQALNVRGPAMHSSPRPSSAIQHLAGAQGGRDSSCSTVLHGLHSTPSSSKLYQRRFGQLLPTAGKSSPLMAHVAMPFLPHSPPASISSLEALLSQRSPLHVASSLVRNNTQ